MIGAAAFGEEALILGVCLGKAGQEGRIHFVGGARDAGANRGDDPRAAGAEAFHRRDRGIGHPAHRAFPPGMRRADHASLPVREQDRRAVGGEDTQRQAGPIGHQGVGMGADAIFERLQHSHAVGRMNLVQRDEPGAGQHRLGRTPAVLRDQFRVVAGAEPDVQACHVAGRDAAAPAEKAVGNASQRAGVVPVTMVYEDSQGELHKVRFLEWGSHTSNS